MFLQINNNNKKKSHKMSLFFSPAEFPVFTVQLMGGKHKKKKKKMTIFPLYLFFFPWWVMKSQLRHMQTVLCIALPPLMPRAQYLVFLSNSLHFLCAFQSTALLLAMGAFCQCESEADITHMLCQLQLVFQKSLFRTALCLYSPTSPSLSTTTSSLKVLIFQQEQGKKF